MKGIANSNAYREQYAANPKAALSSLTEVRTNSPSSKFADDVLEIKIKHSEILKSIETFVNRISSNLILEKTNVNAIPKSPHIKFLTSSQMKDKKQINES